jgi:hypothetical protein
VIEAQHSEASPTESLNAPSGDALLEADAAHRIGTPAWVNTRTNRCTAALRRA